VASQDDLLMTGAWDSCVKFWQVTPTGLAQTREKIQLKTAVLSMDICENRAVAGTFDNKVVQFDTRESIKRISYYKSHSRPVLEVKMTPTKIYSISEDTNLVIHDRVAGKLFKKVKIPQVLETEGQRRYPLSMDSVGNCLYVGDSSGNLNLFDTTADTAFQFVQSYKTGHAGRVSGVWSGMGSIITSGTDGAINIFQPSRDLQPLASLQLDGGNVVTGISYKNQILAASTCNNAVYIWTPNQ
jgi:WD40 repeat protein